MVCCSYGSYEESVWQASMVKKSDLDEPMLRIAERMLRIPPKLREATKLGKDKARPSKKYAIESKARPASKGRVHKGRTRA